MRGMSAVSKVKKAVKIFISYSHEDIKMKEQLLKHLKALERVYNVEAWHDGCIYAGYNIEDVVFEELEKSDIVLLLISNYYIASNFCYSKEMKIALQNHHNKKCNVIPIILSSTNNLDKMPFNKLKSFPTDRKPITKFNPRTEGYSNVVECISNLLDNKYSKYNRQNIVDETTQSKEPVPVPISFKIYKAGLLEDYEVNQSLLTEIKNFSLNINDFHKKMNDTLLQHISSYGKYVEQSKRKFDKIRLYKLQSFLLDICMNTKTCLFSNVGARIHFRRLKCGSYFGFTAIDGIENISPKIDWEHQLSPLNKDNNMVLHAISCNHILIKSLNKKFHSKSSNDKVWVDYATCGFSNIQQAKGSLLSMGVSIHKDYIKSYQYKLLCLSFYRFDNIIENYIQLYIDKCMAIDKAYDINSIITA